MIEPNKIVKKPKKKIQNIYNRLSLSRSDNVLNVNRGYTDAKE